MANNTKAKRKSVKVKKSMKDYMGDAYSPEHKFRTYDEIAEIYNRGRKKPVSRNTICGWYHKAMYKLAEEMTKEMNLPPEEIKKVSRSIEFQMYIKDMMEDIMKNPGDSDD